MIVTETSQAGLGACHCIFEYLLADNGLVAKVDVIKHSRASGIYGEKEDVQKFMKILHSQLFPNPTMTMLREVQNCKED